MQLPNIKDARIRTKEKIEVSYDKYKVPESIHNIGHNKTYTILTYGCQMNVHDSENISGIMEDLGYTKEENYEKKKMFGSSFISGNDRRHDRLWETERGNK